MERINCCEVSLPYQARYESEGSVPCNDWKLEGWKLYMRLHRFENDSMYRSDGFHQGYGG